jgi:hypothetical protein
LAVEPVKMGPIGAIPEQPAPSPARSAARLNWPLSLTILDLRQEGESTVRIAELGPGIRSCD